MVYQLWTGNNYFPQQCYVSLYLLKNKYLHLQLCCKTLQILKRSNCHIICAWILLICFIAGQYVVFTHQHKTATKTFRISQVAKTSAKQTVSEKCQLCDAMHHNSMVLNNSVYFNTTAVAEHVFQSIEYSFTSIQLILSSGRAPPVSFSIA